MFITNVDFDSVTIISDVSHTVVANVSVGTLPYGIVFDFGRGELFVANYGDNSVSAIFDSTYCGCKYSGGTPAFRISLRFR